MLLRVGALPANALDAAAAFHSGTVPRLCAQLAANREDVVLLFAPANHEHRAWRLAVVQQLARDHAPLRVNGLESDDEKAIAAAFAYVQEAPGLTGQLLRLDGIGASALLSPST